jgi:hypothetical protein
MTADPKKTIETMIEELARSQQASLEEQRAYSEALRSLLARMAALCHDGYFVFDATPNAKWIAVASILEILEGAKEILNGPSEGHTFVDGSGVVLRRDLHSGPGHNGDSKRSA